MGRAPVVVVMGVTGSGKSTVGRRLAAALDVEFLDADDFHSPENVAAMRVGQPLDDAKRAPWLDELHAELARRRARGCVLACSALNQWSRRRLTGELEHVRFVALVGDRDLLRRRIDRRRGHFATSALLDSQLATLDLRGVDVVVDTGRPVDDVVSAALEALTAGGPRRVRP